MRNENTFAGSVHVGGAVSGVDVLFHAPLHLATRRNLPLDWLSALVIAHRANSLARVCMRWHSESYPLTPDMN